MWDNKEEEDSRKLKTTTKRKLSKFLSNGCVLIALGRYIEKSVKDNGYECVYLPHPASRDKKYINVLKSGLLDIIKV